MLVLIGPSASGKTESAKIMINRYPISRVVTCTTRKKELTKLMVLIIISYQKPNFFS